jgi:hypothetical protein
LDQLSVALLCHADRVDDDDEVAAELTSRMDRDQQARSAALAGDPLAWDLVRTVDADNTRWLEAVLDDRGWPPRSGVGEAAATAAWLLAQHADQRPEFQRRCLALLTEAVAVGEADPAHLAYLTDRVRRAEGRPQLYGTQFWHGPDGTGDLVAQPIEDMENLDERRRRVGLTPFAEYEKLMRERPA